jgi:hypothetical protein
MELTKEHFDQQLKSLATKNDVNAIDQRVDSLPTHKELEKFATKDDLLRFATKDDLLELATKNDLASVRTDIAEVKELVERIDKRTDEDLRAALHDISDLKGRVSILERSATKPLVPTFQSSTYAKRDRQFLGGPFHNK